MRFWLYFWREFLRRRRDRRYAQPTLQRNQYGYPELWKYEHEQRQQASRPASYSGCPSLATTSTSTVEPSGTSVYPRQTYEWR